MDKSKDADKEEDPSIIDTFRILKDRKMQLVLPLTAYRGYIMACQSCVYVNFWVSTMNTSVETASWSEDVKIVQTVYTFMAFSIGCIMGGSVLGKLMDKYGHTTALVFMLVEIMIGSVLLLV